MGGPVALLGAWRPARSFFAASLILVSVSWATRGQTDMRGLVTAGRAVRLERSAALGSNVTTGVDHERWLFIGVSRVVPRAATWIDDGQGNPACRYSRTASDQAQPASSRATATLAMTGRLR